MVQVACIAVKTVCVVWTIMGGGQHHTDLHSRVGAGGGDACATMGALSSPFCSWGAMPRDVRFNPCNIGCESAAVNFPVEEQGLPGIPWDTSDTLMPTRHFSALLHRCLERSVAQGRSQSAVKTLVLF